MQFLIRIKLCFQKGPIADKRGFTLLEMIAALAVFVILMSGVAALTPPSVQIFMKSTNLSRGENVCSDVLSLMTSELAYATSIQLGEEWGGSAEVAGAKSATYQSTSYGEVNFDNTEEGIISLKLADNSGKISYNEAFYMGNKLQIGLSREKEDVLLISAAIFDRNDHLIGKQKRYVRLLNISP